MSTFFFSFFSQVAGLAIIGVCILLKVNSTSKHIQEVIQEAGEIHQFNVAIYAMAGIGAIVLLISLVGCCAAIFESKFLLGLVCNNVFSSLYSI